MIWLIGDIHGCLWELNALLRKIPAGDDLIFLGDYIDRGPESKAVVERVMQETHRSIYLKGNHEQMLLDHFRTQQPDRESVWLHPNNGGLETLLSYELNDDAQLENLPKTHRIFFEKLLPYHEAADFIAVHAGVNIDIPDMREQDEDDFLWIRKNWIRREAFWRGKPVFYGHTPAKSILGPEREDEIIQGKRSTGIDTGCVYGGSLTAINPRTQKIIQVKAAKRYW